jgi:IS605 OrfB family transposase
MPTRVRTIQDRMQDHSVLDALARLARHVELALYLELRKGRCFTGDLAKTFYQGFGISAKNLDHVHAGLKARMESERECALLHVQQLTEKIAAKDRDVARREQRIMKARSHLARLAKLIRPDQGEIAKWHQTIRISKFAIHQHSRRIATLEHCRAEARSRADDVRLCFGSRSLLRERPKLTVEADIEAWRVEWDRRRGGEVFVPGEAKAADGNQFVRLEPREDGSWAVVLRLPVALAAMADRKVKSGGVEHHEVVVGTVRFPHGGEAFRATLNERADGDRSPVSWRFQRHEKGGWLVSTTFRESLPDIAVPDYRNGALGVDFNVGHLALCLTDGDGNPRRFWTVPLVTHSRSNGQNLDASRKAALEVAGIASRYHVSVVAEALDFSKKKSAVTAEQGARYAGMLNGLAYATFGEALTSACQRHGIMLCRVNPAYTSIIGFAKFARPHGIDVHHAAACAIARRGQGFSERVPESVEVHLGAGVHVTLPRPEVSHEIGIVEKAGKGRMPLSSRRHVWTSWFRIAQGRKAALTARARSLRKERSSGSSGGDAVGSVGSTGRAGVRVPGASPRARGLRGAVERRLGGTDDQLLVLAITALSG